MFVPVVRACSLMHIQRVRKLKYPGEVLVQEGQQVYPEEVIAETVMPTEIVMVEIADSLGVENNATKEFLVRDFGEYLYEGDMIAQISGTLPRLVRAPVNGRFIDLHHGKAVFEVGHSTIKVQAGMIGVVETIVPEYGALLSTLGLLQQGMWGNGKIGMGDLRINADTWSTTLEASLAAEVGQGELLAAGACSDPEALALLGTNGACGLILGLMAPGLIQIAQYLAFPIIVLQGFGTGQPDPSTLDRLTPHVGKPASLNASEADHLMGTRPEVIIPMDGEAEAGRQALSTQEKLRVGQRVRVFSGSHWGMAGEIKALPEDKTTFESGAQLPAAVIRFSDKETASVPLQNLVIIDEVNAQ